MVPFISLFLSYFLNKFKGFRILIILPFSLYSLPLCRWQKMWSRLRALMTTILNSPTVRSHSSVYLFIYLFLALLSLPCGARALCCGIWAFSSCSSQVLLLSWSMGSTTGKLSSCGTRAQLLPDIWDPSSLLSPGVAPGTPELEVRFLPTGLPVILNLASIKLSFSFCSVVLL